MDNKILILDDDVQIAVGVEYFLREQNFSAASYYSSEDIFKLLETNYSPDLAILDIRLSGENINGIDVGKRILAKKKIPLIFYSELVLEERYNNEIKEKIGSDFFFVLDNKFDYPKLLEIINLVLNTDN